MEAARDEEGVGNRGRSKLEEEEKERWPWVKEGGGRCRWPWVKGRRGGRWQLRVWME